jgi:hypothetical protein
VEKVVVTADPLKLLQDKKSFKCLLPEAITKLRTSQNQMRRGFETLRVIKVLCSQGPPFDRSGNFVVSDKDNRNSGGFNRQLDRAFTVARKLAQVDEDERRKRRHVTAESE